MKLKVFRHSTAEELFGTSQPAPELRASERMTNTDKDFIPGTM